MRLKTAPTADLTDRDALVLAHVDLVRSLAGRLGRRVPSHVEVSDLVSVGVMGLIDAASRFQPALGVPFDAFARRRINGAMLDALRGLDWVPRSVRKRQRDLDDTLTRLRHTLRREPEPKEIAASLGVTVEHYDAILDDLRWTDLAVVSRTGSDEDGTDLLDIAIDLDGGPHAQLERRELKAGLARALASLPERERHILALYYLEELTMAEIGEVIGVGESRVSQLRTQAIARLRSMMREWIACPVGERS
jgi:RNA polymerase sigma factor for flagellar operon FliA